MSGLSPDRQYITRTIYQCMAGKVDRRIGVDRRKTDRREDQWQTESAVPLTAEEIAVLLQTH